MSASFTDDERDYLFRGLHERIERDETRAEALKESLRALVDHWEKKAGTIIDEAKFDTKDESKVDAVRFLKCAKELRELLDK